MHRPADGVQSARRPERQAQDVRRRPVELEARVGGVGVRHPAGLYPGRNGVYGCRMADVEVTREDSVLTITLNRPEVLNALNSSVHRGPFVALRDRPRPPTCALS